MYFGCKMNLLFMRVSEVIRFVSQWYNNVDITLYLCFVGDQVSW